MSEPEARRPAFRLPARLTRSLPVRMLGPVTLLAMGLALSGTYFATNMSAVDGKVSAELRQRLALRLTVLEEGLGRELNEGPPGTLLPESVADAQAQLSELGPDPAMDGGIVVGSAGTVVAATDLRDVGSTTPASGVWTEADREAVQKAAQLATRSLRAVVLPVNAGKLRYAAAAPLGTTVDGAAGSGYLALVADGHWQRAAAVAEVRRDSAMFAAITILAVLLLWGVFTGVLGRRLGALAWAAEELGRGRRVPVGVTGQDEVGRLAAAFEGMASEIERRERDLVNGERRFRALVEQAPVVVFRAGTEGGRLEYVSPRVEQLSGRRPEEVLDAPDPWAAFVHHADLDLLHAAQEKGAARGHYSLEHRVRGAGGNTVRVRHEAVLVDGAEGQHWQGILVDIEQTRRLEEQLAETQKLEAVGRLAGGVAHDFNNLLTAIVGYAALAEAAADPGNEPLRDHLESLSEAVSRASGVTAHLLAFARRAPAQAAQVDLREVVAGLEPLLRTLIEERIHILVQPGSEPLPVLADRGQLEQVLVNLAVNARDAMPQGGILSIATRRWTDADGSEAALLSVADTGTGIPEELQRAIFDPFFTTKPVGVGTGLGLSIVHGMVAEAGGRVELDSREGAGTTFRIVLPLHASSNGHVPAGGTGGQAPGAEATADTGRDRGAANGRAPAVEPARPLDGVRVLLVEDEPPLLHLAVRVLQKAGATVTAASSAEEALALVSSQLDGEPPDVLVSDVVLSGLSGPDLGRRLREDAPCIPIVLVSGYLADEKTDVATVYLAKPYTPAAFVRAVAEAVARGGTATAAEPLAPTT